MEGLRLRLSGNEGMLERLGHDEVVVVLRRGLREDLWLWDGG